MSHRPTHPLLPELHWLEQLIERGHPHLQAREARRIHMPGGPSFPVHAITLGNPDPALPAVGYFGGVHGLERIGAEVVIAVDLNHQIVGGKNFKSLQARRTPAAAESARATTPVTLSDAAPWLAGYRRAMQDLKTRLQGSEWARGLALAQGVAPPSNQEPMPSIFEVLLASINVMETRITQTRLALEPPEVLIQPPLGHIRFLEFARADELIQIGYDAARQALATSPALQGWRGQANQTNQA